MLRYRMTRFLTLAIRTQLSIFLVISLYAISPFNLASAEGCTFRSPAFDYFPGVGPRFGETPHEVTATWLFNWSWNLAVDDNGEPVFGPAPTFFIDWGDGTEVQVPHEQCEDFFDDGTSAGFFRNWPEQELSHTYNSPGTYTWQFISRSDGEDDYVMKEGDIIVEGEPIDNEDSDGDGIVDSEDQCPDDPGSDSNNGCPEDSDGDETPDEEDDCPNLPGPISNNGCPEDSDGDETPDEEDDCPNLPGPISNNGCPEDSDSDGIFDEDDDCPEEPGPVSNNGCPEEEMRTFEIKFMAFIPANYVDPHQPVGSPSPEAWCRNRDVGLRLQLIFSGDNRGFNSSSSKYRVLQTITLFEDTDRRGRKVLKIKRKSAKKRVSKSFSYVGSTFGLLENVGALEHGVIDRIDSSDNDGVRRDCVLFHNKGRESGNRVKKPYEARFSRPFRQTAQIVFEGKSAQWVNLAWSFYRLELHRYSRYIS